MDNAVKHIFFFVLIIAVGSAVTQQNVAQWGNIDNSQSDSTTLCQQISDTGITSHSGDMDPLFEHAPESNSNDAQPRTTTLCISMMNTLPAENNFSFNPGGQQVNIGFYNAFLFSQTFVFQEPDPPQLG